MTTMRAWLVAVALPGLVLAADENPALFTKVQANQRVVAQTWYKLAGKAPVARLEFPNFTGTATLRVELPLPDGFSRKIIGWAADKQQWACPCDGDQWVSDAGAGTLKGSLTVLLPAGMESSPSMRRAAALLTETAPHRDEEITILLDGRIADGKFSGSFSCATAGSGGTVTGLVVPMSTASGYPEFVTNNFTPADYYRLAAGLELDAVRKYSWIRALSAAGMNPAQFAAALSQGCVPVPLRPGFLLEAFKSPPPARDARRPVSSGPSLDEAMDEGSKPAKTAALALEESARKRAPLLEAMAAHTAGLAELALKSQRTAGSVPIERGRTFDDPLFGPWYGTSMLTKVPADAGGPGVQDWPFVHGWQFLGPFDYLACNWDPVRLPDCRPVANTEFAGKTGPVKWRSAQINPAGCAILTDVEPADILSETEAEQAPDTPARAKIFKPVVYYAVTNIEAEREADVFLAAGCTGRMSIWIDEVLVARGPTTAEPSDITQEALVFRAKLRRGTNRILVRCEADAYGLFSHRRPGTASYFWMRVCVRGVPGDARPGQEWLARVARQKESLPNLPANVRGFRHDQTGFGADADPVTAWDLERGINVLWTTAIERWSKASPVVVGDQVFVCAEPHVLVCVDGRTGKLLWRRSANVLEAIDPALGAASEKLHQAYLAAKAAAAPELAAIGPDYAARLRALSAQGRELPRIVRDLAAMEAGAEKAYRAFFEHLSKHAKLVMPAWDGHFSGPWLGYSFATPVTDGHRVYVQFRTGATAAFDLEGNRLWLRHTPYEVGGVSVCSSPVLAEDKLVIMQPLAAQRTGGTVALVALDSATGQTAWTAKADSRSQISSPVVLRLTNGTDQMSVIATDGGTVVRAADGKVLVSGLRGGCGTGSPTPVGDTLYRIELAQGGAVQLIMLDRDTVGARWRWSCSGLFNSIYAGVGHHNGLLFGTTHGGSQCINSTGLDLISATTGQRVERPFNAEAAKSKQGIFAIGRAGFIPPMGTPRAIFLAVRGQGHASSLAEELPKRWSPYSDVSVAQPGALGRFIAHNKVVGPLTPHPAFAADRVYLRNDQELTCFGYTGDQGRVYEAEVNAATILADIAETPPADPQAAAQWRAGIAHAKPFLDRVIQLKPDSPVAKRAQALLAR